MYFSSNFLAIFAFTLLLIGVTVSMHSNKKTEKEEEVGKSENEGEKVENPAELEVEKWSPGISIPGRRMSRLLQVDNLTQQNTDDRDGEQIGNLNSKDQHAITMVAPVLGYFKKKMDSGDYDRLAKWNAGDGMEAISIASRGMVIDQINQRNNNIKPSKHHEMGGGSDETKQMNNESEQYPIHMPPVNFVSNMRPRDSRLGRPTSD